VTTEGAADDASRSAVAGDQASGTPAGVDDGDVTAAPGAVAKDADRAGSFSDRVVVLFDARGTATDGRPYVNSYAWFFRMRSGRVIEANAFFDAIAFDDLWSRITPAG
jgi:ketosteroid isomerase-like protein